MKMPLMMHFEDYIRDHMEGHMGTVTALMGRLSSLRPTKVNLG